MQISRERVVGEIAKLNGERMQHLAAIEQSTANVHAVDGALIQCRAMLAIIDAPEPEAEQPDAADMAEMFSSKPLPVVVYGPQGCGKTRQAERLKKDYGCNIVVDEWDGESPLHSGDLALTNLRPPFTFGPVRVVEFVDAWDAHMQDCPGTPVEMLPVIADDEAEAVPSAAEVG